MDETFSLISHLDEYSDAQSLMLNCWLYHDLMDNPPTIPIYNFIITETSKYVLLSNQAINPQANTPYVQSPLASFTISQGF